MSLKKVYTLIFFVGLFFFSFNDYEGIPFLGEFKKEAGAIFFLSGFILMMLETLFSKKIIIPHKNIIFKVLVLFIVWCFITTILNLSTVSTNYFKNTSGFIRFIRQYFSLILSSLIFFLFYYNVLSKMRINEILYKVRKALFLSFIIATVYGFLEILIVYFGFGFLKSIIKLFDYFPFLEVALDINGRISSICYEPPFFAIYLITISGWMFSYILTEKSILKFIPTFLVLILTFYCGSRTGLLVVFFQLFIFILILFKEEKNRSYILIGASLISIFFVLIIAINGEKISTAISEKIESLNFSKNLKKNISNQSRFGMQYAALMVFKDHPLIGVGFGQQTYHSRFHYPGWATRNNYEFKEMYKNSAEPSFPPGYNIYTRILSETGIIGFVLILILIYLTYKRLFILIRGSTDDKQILAYILMITFSGLLINWAQIDTFRIYGIWISLAILIKIDYQKTNE